MARELYSASQREEADPHIVFPLGISVEKSIFKLFPILKVGLLTESYMIVFSF